MTLGQTTLGAAVAGGMMWASAAGIVWLPLSASWRQPHVRRRRLAAAVVFALSSVFLGVVATQLLRRPLSGVGSIPIWFLGYQAWSLILLAVVVVSNRVRCGSWWSYAEGDSASDRGLWALIPALTCFVAAAAMGLSNALFQLSAEHLLRHSGALAGAAVASR